MTRDGEPLRLLSQKGIFSQPFWWFMFALDSFFLSVCFQLFKEFTLYPDWPHGLRFLGAIGLMALCTFALVYDSYIKERAQGKVQHPVKLFEWMLSSTDSK